MATFTVSGIFEAAAGSNIYNGVGVFSNSNILRYSASPGGIDVFAPKDIYTMYGTVKNGWGGSDQYIRIQLIEGTKFNDRVVMTNDNDLGPSFELFAGDDTVDGANSLDANVSYWWSPAGILVDLEAGYALDGWGGRDVLINVHHIETASANNDTLLGSSGTDFFVGLAGNDHIDGRGGYNFATYQGFNALNVKAVKGANIDLESGLALDEFGTRDTLVNIQGIIGSLRDDTISGDANDNFFDPGLGNDLINGRLGEDTIAFRNGGVVADPRPIYANVAGRAYDGVGGFDFFASIERFFINSVHQTVAGKVDLLVGNSENQLFSTGGSDAVVLTGLGNDLVQKNGLGNITVVYSGPRASYGITRGPDDSVTIVKPIGSDFLKGVSKLQFSDVALDARTLGATAFVNFSAGTPGDDVQFGTSGNDVLVATGGKDAIYGGDGRDTLQFSTNSNNFAVKREYNGMLTVKGVGIDHVVDDVERLRFSDKILAFDEVTAQAYRIYQAAFNRLPDQGGLSFWANQMDNGALLLDVARGFLSSSEAKAVYGSSPSSAMLVDLFYRNVLGRAAEPAGIAFWKGELDRGAKSAAEVLAGFSESAENVSRVAPLIQSGISLDLIA